jgi:hypothetical protein
LEFFIEGFPPQQPFPFSQDFGAPPPNAKKGNFPPETTDPALVSIYFI